MLVRCDTTCAIRIGPLLTKVLRLSVRTHLLMRSIRPTTTFVRAITVLLAVSACSWAQRDRLLLPNEQGQIQVRPADAFARAELPNASHSANREHSQRIARVATFLGRSDPPDIGKHRRRPCSQRRGSRIQRANNLLTGDRKHVDRPRPEPFWIRRSRFATTSCATNRPSRRSIRAILTARLFPVRDPTATTFRWTSTNRCSVGRVRVCG